MFTDALECPNATFDKFSAVYATQIFRNRNWPLLTYFSTDFHKIFTDALECPNTTVDKFSVVYATKISGTANWP